MLKELGQRPGDRTKEDVSCGLRQEPGARLAAGTRRGKDFFDGRSDFWSGALLIGGMVWTGKERGSEGMVNGYPIVEDGVVHQILTTVAPLLYGVR